MNKLKYYDKIKKYCVRKEALEIIEINLKRLVSGKYVVESEELQLKYDRQIARELLRLLIFDLLFEQNPYNEILELRKRRVLDNYFQKYNIDINFVSKEDIDTLFTIIKKI